MAIYPARKIRNFQIPGMILGCNSGKSSIFYQTARSAFAFFRCVPAWRSPPLPSRSLQHFVKIAQLPSMQCFFR